MGRDWLKAKIFGLERGKEKRGGGKGEKGERRDSISIYLRILQKLIGKQYLRA